MFHYNFYHRQISPRCGVSLFLHRHPMSTHPPRQKIHWMKIYRASGGDSFSLDHGNRISCFDSGSPIRGELRFVGLAEKFSKVEQREAGKRIARNKPARRFPLPAIWICRKGSLLFIFWGPMEGEIVCVRGGRLRALISGLMLHTAFSPRKNFARST